MIVRETSLILVREEKELLVIFLLQQARQEKHGKWLKNLKQTIIEKYNLLIKWKYMPLAPAATVVNDIVGISLIIRVARGSNKGRHYGKSHITLCCQMNIIPMMNIARVRRTGQTQGRKGWKPQLPHWTMPLHQWDPSQQPWKWRC